MNNGAPRVAVLDLDFQRDNGTQGIFYTHDDVLFISVHDQPDDVFPHFPGYADEVGEGAGEGFNTSYPIASEIGFEQRCAALQDGLCRVTEYPPDALIISLGVDTFENDPISFLNWSATILQPLAATSQGQTCTLGL